MTDPAGEPLARETTDSSEQEKAEPKLSRRQTLTLPIIAASPNLTQAR